MKDASGVPVGTLVPQSADWTIRFASGEREIYVLRGSRPFVLASYVASQNDRELCRFRWTMPRTVWSAEMQIEFTPDADPALRLLAIALAPILELRSRLRNERRMPP